MMYQVSFPGLGWSFDISPVAFSIGGFQVYWYGVIIGAGFLLALWMALSSLKRFGIDKNGFIDCVLVGLVCGLLGARLYYVFFKWDYYSQHLDELLAIHNGGLAIYGGVIGGLLGGCLVARHKKLPIPAILDVTVMGFLIGQGLGRWGNFFNQEAFGTPTDLPWRMVSENTGGVGVHPCFLYESLWCLLGFGLLYWFSRKWRQYDGQIFLLYLVWYGAERMVVEGLRTDSLYTPLFGLRVSQIVAAVTMLLGVILLIVFRRRRTKAVDTAAGMENGTQPAASVTDSDAETVVFVTDNSTQSVDPVTNSGTARSPATDNSSDSTPSSPEDTADDISNG